MTDSSYKQRLLQTIADPRYRDSLAEMFRDELITSYQRAPVLKAKGRDLAKSQQRWSESTIPNALALVERVIQFGGRVRGLEPGEVMGAAITHLDAAARHLESARWNREATDHESGLPHLAHAAARLLLALEVRSRTGGLP